MKFCSNCGFKLISREEKFCPECGANLHQMDLKGTGGAGNNNPQIKIKDANQDVVGIGGSGFGNITGKEISYNLRGNVIYLINPSKEAIDGLKNIIQVQTKLNTQLDYVRSETYKELITTKQQVTQVLEVDKISDEKGTEIREIRSEEMQMSKSELLLKQIILKGNEHYYNNEYSEAIGWYDKAIDMDPTNFDVWFNKGYALGRLKKYEEALSCLDKAIEINSNDADTWNNKGIVLDKLSKYEDAIYCYNKALEIDSKYADVWFNRACSKVKKGDVDSGLVDLEKAIEIEKEKYIEMAKEDIDFDSIKNNDRFKALILSDHTK